MENTPQPELQTPVDRLRIDTMQAANVDEFWGHVDSFRALSDTINPRFINALHERWRGDFIANRMLVQAESIVAENSHNLPPLNIEGCDSVKVEVYEAHVAYDSPQALVSDLRSFFNPRLEPLPEDTLSAEKNQRRLELAKQSIYRHLAYTNTDITNRLEQEITAWAEEGAQGTFVDPEAKHTSEPYRESAGRTLYMDRAISVRRGDDGSFLLGVRGGFAGPTYAIEELAAYCDRDVINKGTFQITYVSEPPALIEPMPEGDEFHTTKASIPIVAIRQHLAQVLGVGNEGLDQIEGDIIDASRGRRTVLAEEISYANDQLAIQPTSDMRIPKRLQFSNDGRSLIGDTFYNKSTDEEGDDHLSLPQVSFLITIFDAARATQTARTLKAQSHIASQPANRKSYATGYVGGYGDFSVVDMARLARDYGLDESIHSRLQPAHAEQPATVSPEHIVASDVIEFTPRRGVLGSVAATIKSWRKRS